jgi:uncharacterized membrane protein
MLGKYLGWGLIQVPSIYVCSFLTLLVLSIFKEENEGTSMNYKTKLWIAFIVILVFALVNVSMLFTWTPMSQPYISGVQGRYLLPILPLVLLLFRNNIITLKRNINNLLIFVICLTQVLTIWNVFITMISSTL